MVQGKAQASMVAHLSGRHDAKAEERDEPQEEYGKISTVSNDQVRVITSYNLHTVSFINFSISIYKF